MAGCDMVCLSSLRCDGAEIEFLIGETFKGLLQLVRAELVAERLGELGVQRDDECLVADSAENALRRIKPRRRSKPGRRGALSRAARASRNGGAGKPRGGNRVSIAV